MQRAGARTDGDFHPADFDGCAADGHTNFDLNGDANADPHCDSNTYSNSHNHESAD